MKMEGEKNFNLDFTEIREKLLEKSKGINPRTLDTFALSISGLIDILKTMQFSEPEITRYTNIVVHYSLTVCVPEVMASLNGTTVQEIAMLESIPEEIAHQISAKIQEMSSFELFTKVSFQGGEYPAGIIAFKEDLLKPFCLGGNLNQFLRCVCPGFKSNYNQYFTSGQ